MDASLVDSIHKIKHLLLALVAFKEGLHGGAIEPSLHCTLQQHGPVVQPLALDEVLFVEDRIQLLARFNASLLCSVAHKPVAGHCAAHHSLFVKALNPDLSTALLQRMRRLYLVPLLLELRPRSSAAEFPEHAVHVALRRALIEREVGLEEEWNAVHLDLQRRVFDRLDRVEELALADVTIGSHGVGDELHLDDAAPAGAFVHLIALQ